MEYLENLKFTNEYWQIGLPIILMLADILTGYISAKIQNQVKSEKMRTGLGKKVAEIVYITVGMIFGIAFDIKIVGTFISLYIIYMELISLAENCKKLGVPVDEKIVGKFTGKLNNKEEE